RGHIEARPFPQLVDVDRARQMPPEIADVRYVDDHAARQLVLDADVEGHHARRFQFAGKGGEVGREIPGGAAARVVDVAIEDIGDSGEGRVAAGGDQYVGRSAVIKDPVAAAH